MISCQHRKTNKKSLKMWIKQNRVEIDEVIKSVYSNCRLNDAERELWVLNEEYLYKWARSENVDV